MYLVCAGRGYCSVQWRKRRSTWRTGSRLSRCGLEAEQAAPMHRPVLYGALIAARAQEYITHKLHKRIELVCAEKAKLERKLEHDHSLLTDCITQATTASNPHYYSQYPRTTPRFRRASGVPLPPIAVRGACAYAPVVIARCTACRCSTASRPTATLRSTTRSTGSSSRGSCRRHAAHCRVAQRTAAVCHRAAPQYAWLPHCQHQ